MESGGIKAPFSHGDCPATQKLVGVEVDGDASRGSEGKDGATLEGRSLIHSHLYTRLDTKVDILSLSNFQDFPVRISLQQ